MKQQPQTKKVKRVKKRFDKSHLEDIATSDNMDELSKSVKKDIDTQNMDDFNHERKNLH